MEDRVSTEYHLTPDGWVAGIDFYFDKPQGRIVDPPSNRVLTIEIGTEQSYHRSKDRPFERVRWQSSD